MEHTNEHASAEKTDTCPMHPEVSGQKGEKCPKCGMDLMAEDNEKKYQVKLSTQPETFEAGTPTELIFTFEENGNTVDLEIAHEMKVHLMVISEDLTWFRHIHPEEKLRGIYSIKETFPEGGKYLLFIDFKPKGGASIVSKKVLEVAGTPKTMEEGPATKLVSHVDGYTVKLENGKDFRTNRNQTVAISVEKDEKKLTEKDIEQYLGASSHILMVGKADKDYLHIHSVSDSRFPIFAETFIEKADIYRIWVQFQIDGKVLTADFTVNVEKGEKSDDREHHHGLHHH